MAPPWTRAQCTFMLERLEVAPDGHGRDLGALAEFGDPDFTPLLENLQSDLSAYLTVHVVRSYIHHCENASRMVEFAF